MNPSEEKSWKAYAGDFRLKHPSGKDSSHLMSKTDRAQSKLDAFTLFVISGECRSSSSHKI